MFEDVCGASAPSQKDAVYFVQEIFTSNNEIHTVHIRRLLQEEFPVFTGLALLFTKFIIPLFRMYELIYAIRSRS